MISTRLMKVFYSSLAALAVTGCASTPLEKGPSMDSVWSSGFDGQKSTVDLVKSGLTVNPMLAGADAGYPMVTAPTILPIWERGKNVGEFIKTDGRWIYEIVDPGGFVSP